MIVNAQIDETVVEAAIAATCANNEQCCRLLSPAIPSRCLTSSQCCHQPVTQGARRLFKGVCHGQHGIFSDQNVALTGIMFSRVTSRPGKTLVACIGRRFTVGSNDSHLAGSAACIFVGKLCYRLCCREATCQQFQSAGSIACVGPGLRCNSPYARFCPWNDRANRQKL